jgi:ketosteroid isomerase-like protein
MKPAVLLFPLFSALLSALAVAQSPAPSTAPAPIASAPSVELPADLARVLRDYEQAWTAADSEALARLFTTDGYALPSGQPPAAGASAIRQAYKKNAGSPLVLRALHYAQSGDMAYIIGGFGWEAGKPDFGKFVLVLRKDKDGRWLIAADMDNANAPPPKPVQAAKR